jgi:type IV pilus assembly protein PilE
MFDHSMRNRAAPGRQAGVTLIELMTVTLVVGILAGIAIPTYRQYTLRANRTDAKTSLLSQAGALERCYTRYNKYTLNTDPALGCNLPATSASQNGYYQVTITVQDVPTPGAQFLLTAVPQGAQAQDSGCGSLTLNSVNTRDRSGTKSIDECWGK